MKKVARKMKTVTFRLRLSEQLRLEIAQVAAALDVSDSEFARKAIQRSLKVSRQMILRDRHEG